MGENPTRAVVVHAGRRDGYQLALALEEDHLLEALVTDVYWDEPRHRRLSAMLPPSARLPERFCAGLDPRRVTVSWRSAYVTAAMTLHRRWDCHAFSDRALGLKARAVAARAEAAVLAYSYYAHHAFRPGPGQARYRFLFQMHPHPGAVRQILLEERARAPHGRASLDSEVELRLTGKALEALEGEPLAANGWLAASSFTAKTLSERGVPAGKIHVVPYGVDLARFRPRESGRATDGPLTVIYVGRLVQHKGLSYLLEAVRSLKTKNVRLLLRGQGSVDHEMLAQYPDIDYDLKVGVPTPDLVRDLQRSDLLALPSLVEGFGHVILEAMACGLPVIATPHSCAPDVLEEGTHGFIVPIRSPDALREKIEWALENRKALAWMGRCAAQQAQRFTWERFRAGIRDAYAEMLTDVALSEIG